MLSIGLNSFILNSFFSTRYCSRIIIAYIIVTRVCTVVTIMLKRTGTKQRSDDRTTNLSRLIMIGNLRIDLFLCDGVGKMNGGKPVNPKCGLRVECGENIYRYIFITNTLTHTHTHRGLYR